MTKKQQPTKLAKGDVVYFNGDFKTKQKLRGTIVLLYHRPTKQSFDLIGAAHKWFPETDVVLDVTEVSMNGDPYTEDSKYQVLRIIEAGKVLNDG